MFVSSHTLVLLAFLLATGLSARAQSPGSPAGSSPPAKADETPAAAAKKKPDTEQQPAETPAPSQPASITPPAVDEPELPKELENIPLDPEVTGSPNPLLAASAGAPVTPTHNVTINLINRLVQRGVLTQADAAELIQQAEQDAEIARAQQEAQVAALQELNPPAEDGEVRVAYIPEVVKNQIRDEIKNEVMAQAQAEGWAAPNEIPGWTQVVTINGDIRTQYEARIFPEGNDNTGAFPNFNIINAGEPFDVSGTIFSPQINVDQNRDRVRLRARLGFDVNLESGFTAGIRLVTGENNTPVSANQSMGLAQQQVGRQLSGGQFSKYALWLDRAFIQYELGGTPDASLAAKVGRFDNPFLTTNLMWDDDIGFDGFALTGHYRLTSWLKPFIAAGAFPVFNTDLNFSTNAPAKFPSDDKWLNAVQFGLDVRFAERVTGKFAVAYYDYDNVEGRLSDPFVPLTPEDHGNTDNTRPSFSQKGNTYMALRDIVPSPLNNFGTTHQYQYFGLATPFRNLTYTARFDVDVFEPYRLTLMGEHTRNLDFDAEAINAHAVNNRGPHEFLPDGSLGAIGPYEGGDTAWILNLVFGKAKFERAGDWSVGVGYRYMESDSMIDGFVDSQFGGGGTNMQGYTIGAALAVSPSVFFSFRWMSANELAGPPMKTDIFLLDVTAKF